MKPSVRADIHHSLATRLELVGGKLVPKTGFENKGDLEYTGSLDISQVSFVSDMGGTILVSPPLFGDDQRQFRIRSASRVADA